jgi:hypothetical protein
LRIGEKPCVSTISRDRLRIAIKGLRKGHKLFWEDLIDGNAALSPSALGREGEAGEVAEVSRAG